HDIGERLGVGRCRLAVDDASIRRRAPRECDRGGRRLAIEATVMTDRRRAQVLVFFALVLPLVLLPVAAYAVDAAVAASAFARLEEVTVHAAEQAALQLDVLRLRSGRGVAVEPGTAQSVARAVIAGSL